VSFSDEDRPPLEPAPTIRDTGPPLDLAPDTDPAPDPVLVALVDVLTELGKVKDELRLSRANDELARSALSNRVDAAIAESRAAHAAAVTATDRADEIMGVVSASHRLLKGEITDHLISIDTKADRLDHKFGTLFDVLVERQNTTIEMLETHIGRDPDSAHGNGIANGHGNGATAEE
jgi:hypothetical protein